jgi:hypothetical protein
LVISISLASTSKIPPQRTKTLYNSFYLFGICHKCCSFAISELAPIVTEILFFFSLKKKRLQWIAGNSFKKTKIKFYLEYGNKFGVGYGD